MNYQIFPRMPHYDLGKSYTFGVFEFRVHIYPSIADSPVQPIHNHGQFYGPQWAWHSTHENRLPWIQRVGTVHHKIRVIQVPRSDLNLEFRWGKEATSFEFVCVAYTHFAVGTRPILLIQFQPRVILVSWDTTNDCYVVKQESCDVSLAAWYQGKD